ncbi:hypothetical protein L7F22_008336 [Adiantum nelumboides]|nr:hypothetical protein [Adiantum nelumboides]
MDCFLHDKVGSFHLPPFESRFPLLTHPNADALIEKGDRWLQEFIAGRPSSASALALGQEVEGRTINLDAHLQSKISKLACRFWPNSLVEQRSIAMLKFLHWIVLFDNLTDDTTEPVGSSPWGTQCLCAAVNDVFSKVSTTHLSLLCLHLPGQMPYLAPTLGSAAMSGCNAEQRRFIWLVLDMLVEWWAELRATMPRLQQARFGHYFLQYILVHPHLCRLREEAGGQVPAGLEEYMRLRCTVAAVQCITLLAEYDLDMELDAEALASPLIQKIREASMNHQAWVNDNYSFPNEYLKGDYFNLLAVLHYRNNTSQDELSCSKPVPFEAAASEAWRMVLAKEEECAELAERVKQDAVLKGYLLASSLAASISGDG